MSHNDSPAFPVPELNWSCGMTLRDYFAAKAMQTILEKIIEVDGSLTTFQVDLTTDGAYLIADAMLRAREN